MANDEKRSHELEKTPSFHSSASSTVTRQEAAPMNADDVERRPEATEAKLSSPSSAPQTNANASANDEKSADPFLVVLDPSEKATAFPFWRKAYSMLVICSSALCVTCASSMATSGIPDIMQQFDVGIEVATLSITLFIFGLGLGPLLFGGLSEFLGRTLIYRISLVSFFLLNFPVAFANNIAVHLIFRFLSGWGGSAFLSLAGGSIGDMFMGPNISNAVALYTLSPFLGPTVGPIIAGFVVSFTTWRWTYYTLIIWIFVETVAIFFVPETYAPTLTNRKAERIRKETGDDRYYSPFDTRNQSVSATIKLSITRPFQLMTYELLVLLLNIWTSLELAIVYIAFSVFPLIFEDLHHFTPWQEGLAFIGLGIGMITATATQPIWNAIDRRTAAKYKLKGERPPPEEMLYMAMAAAILAPIGLYMFAFTVYKQVHWVVPIIVLIPFGTSVLLSFTSTFNFFVHTYKPLAASAMASNSFMRSSFAGALPLAARPMFKAMTNTGALAFLAGVMTLLAPVPFIFYKFGPRLRKSSRYASND